MAEPPRNDVVPINARFLRKLAAVVSGWPETGTYYLIALYDGTDVTLAEAAGGTPVMLNEVEARDEAVARRLDPKVAAQVLGPFDSPGNLETFDVSITSVNSSVNPEHDAPYRVAGNWKVPEGTDLLCWTPAAFDKFVAPYYYILEGADHNAAQEVQLLKQSMMASQSGILFHSWPTKTSVLQKTFKLLDERTGL